MGKLKIVTIWLVLAFIVISHLTRMKYYKQLLSNDLFGYGGGFRYYISTADTILWLLMDLLTVVLGIAALANSDKAVQDRMYSIFRFFYVMLSFLSVPIVIYSIITFGKYIFIDAFSAVTFIFRDLIWITLVVLLIVCKPERTIQKVNLQEYDMVAFTSIGHRFTHYLLDLLFLLPTWLYVAQGMMGARESSLLLQFTFLGCYFVYCFLSEAIFRQTLGKMVTRSCVVSDGVELSTGRVFLRTLSRLIPFDTFSFLFGAKWHDRVSSTAVVYVDSWEKAFDGSNEGAG